MEKSAVLDPRVVFVLHHVFQSLLISLFSSAFHELNRKVVYKG